MHRRAPLKRDASRAAMGPPRVCLGTGHFGRSFGTRKSIGFSLPRRTRTDEVIEYIQPPHTQLVHLLTSAVGTSGDCPLFSAGRLKLRDADRDSGWQGLGAEDST